ncbi:MAG: response regulator [Deltaproteobacteria bacterium]|nr:response regulator [Deltaproteobacteria bacterium]
MSEEKCRILVVDDDPFVGELLAVMLDAEGYEVDTAENGEDALARFTAATDTGLIISDMNMPGMTGLELIRKIRASNPDIPAILLTGSDDLAVGQEADEYLLKDENLQETIAISVARVLERHALKAKGA